MSRAIGVILTAMLVATACGTRLTASSTQAPVTAAVASPTAQPVAKQATRSGITIILTNSECTAEGLGDVLQQQFAAAVVNTTLSRAAVNLQRLNDGHEYSELDSFIQARRRAIAAGGDIDAQPPMTTILVRVQIPAGGRDRLEGKLAAGTYGLVCRRDSASDFSVAGYSPTLAIYLRGPLQVD